jgi:type I restriction enzyme S subunit
MHSAKKETNDKFGLKHDDLQTIISILEQQPCIEEALIFGSRSKGNFKPGSDVDIALKGRQLDFKIVSCISFLLNEETSMPYKFDVLNYHDIKNKDLVEHIDRVGTRFYKRWKEYKLEEIAKVQTGPFGSQLHMSDYKLTGTPIITVEHLGENKITHNDLPLVSNEDKKRLIKYTLEEGDIVFSRVGSVDRRAYVSKEEDGWMFSGRCLRVRANKSIVNPKFLSFYFGQESFKETIRRIAVGATMPSINTEILSNIEIEIPPYKEQISIASILSSFDDKIDLLHRQNKTLEQLAETLFRQWFVEEKKESWQEKSLFDSIELIGGGTPKTEVSEYWDGNIKWLSGSDIASSHKSFVMNTEKSITEIGLINSSTKLLPKFSTVITARGTVGKYCLLSEPMTFSQSNYGIKPKYDSCYFFTYLLVAYSVDELQSAAYGSVFDTITTNTFKEHKILLPKSISIERFEQTVTPYFEKMLGNQTQIKTLTQLRDTLLPKLMSGEVRVEMN